MGIPLNEDKSFKVSHLQRVSNFKTLLAPRWLAGWLAGWAAGDFDGFSRSGVMRVLGPGSTLWASCCPYSNLLLDSEAGWWLIGWISLFFL